MKKLFFTIAVCLLTTLSFAKDKKANENVEPVKVSYREFSVMCDDGFVWYYAGYIDNFYVSTMMAQMASGC